MSTHLLPTIRYRSQPRSTTSRPTPAIGGRRSRAAASISSATYAPHEGSTTLAYGVYNVASLADYEAYRARLAAGSLGQRELRIRPGVKSSSAAKARTFLKLASAPHGTFNGALDQAMIAVIFEVIPKARAQRGLSESRGWTESPIWRKWTASFRLNVFNQSPIQRSCSPCRSGATKKPSRLGVISKSTVERKRKVAVSCSPITVCVLRLS